MNPLTKRATHCPKKQHRQDLLISFGCGSVFAALMVAFVLTAKV